MEIIDRLSANQDALYEVKFEARLQNNTEILAGVEQMEANTEKWLNELLTPPKRRLTNTSGPSLPAWS